MRVLPALVYAAVVTAGVAAGLAPVVAASEEERMAESLAILLRAAREVISDNQNLINDPAVGHKGLTAEKVLADTLALYRKHSGEDLADLDPQSRRGRLLRAQLDSIAKVMNDVQPIIDRKGIGFKGVIPSAFSRMINDEFQERMAAEAEVKVTAPPALIRNRKARPDGWETEMITTHLLKPEWPRGQALAAAAPNRGREAFRVLIPEYYAASCLVCHGEPKGAIDITGYPKEGGREGDLGGVISISIFRK